MKVEGKIYENAFQNGGKELTGHTHPLTNRQIDDMNRSTTNTVSLWRMNLLNVKLKDTQVMIKKNISTSKSAKCPL